MSLLIKNSKNVGNVYIEGGRISTIGKREKADQVVDARGKYVLPGLVNTHTHAAMSLLRGYGDDLPLQTWLEKRIWPAEKKLTPELVYDGTRLAVLEMIKTGTTCFNDMYFFPEMAAKAAKQMGMRASVSYAMIDVQGESKTKKEKKGAEKFLKNVKQSNLITPVLAPHAVYTVSEELLCWAKGKGTPLHIHVSETKKENTDCKKTHGKTPVQYLDSLGFLDETVVAAHCVHLEGKDIAVLAKQNVQVSHCPISNMKLGSGIMPYSKLVKAGVSISLGTDGAASNNSLSMFETMKFASMLHKLKDPLAMPATEAWKCATENGARALGYSGGVIAEGAVADMILVDAKSMVPNHGFVSNLVYSTPDVTDSIINGKIVMEDYVVKGEDSILKKAEKAAEVFK